MHKPLENIHAPSFFRVSLKAVIENERGEVLCVKEKGSDWTLPGGGLDHGESVDEGFRRELREELNFDPSVTYDVTTLGHDVMYLPSRKGWQFWVLFRVRFETLPEFLPGEDADDVGFVDPTGFKDSPYRSQRLMYKWLVDRNYDAGLPY